MLMFQLRTEAFAKEGRYKQELQDAQATMTYAPADTGGYVLTARRYICQGYQKRALDVLNTGLEQVPHTHSDYITLLQEKDIPQKGLDHCVDFFIRLPYDIICHVINYIPTSTIINCSRVFSAWSSLILKHPVLWRDIHTYAVECPTSEPHPYQLLRSISHYVDTFRRFPSGKSSCSTMS
ncbi:hypothetical protein BDA99DRAFT_494389 [Phascolomyces articulosus]|uniref:F-box domain-containing protein n=1 Tax=Phascolomyces articulosus TaxID=60185 RepID=A0AAD5PLA4_9FUNG|nr:hypothetical protein BDA99DRAFT_494389 [Phascolomyces articulosus]